MPTIKAVVFDIGGVVVGSPLIGIAKYEKEHHLPPDYLNVAITARGQTGAFQRLETGKLKLGDFYHQFGADLSDTSKNNGFYTSFCKRTGRTCPPLPQSLTIDGKKLWQTMMSEASTPDSAILEVIRLLRQSGNYKVAALTNNFEKPPGTKDSDEEAMGSGNEALKLMFHEYIESAKTGMRKPDPKFFQYTLDKLEVKASEVVFLDDIGINLKAAQQMGINTIRVDIYDSGPAIHKLQEYVKDVDLSSATKESKPKL